MKAVGTASFGALVLFLSATLATAADLPSRPGAREAGRPMCCGRSVRMGGRVDNWSTHAR